MAFKASFKFSDSREFDVLRWDGLTRNFLGVTICSFL